VQYVPQVDPYFEVPSAVLGTLSNMLHFTITGPGVDLSCYAVPVGPRSVLTVAHLRSTFRKYPECRVVAVYRDAVVFDGSAADFSSQITYNTSRDFDVGVIQFPPDDSRKFRSAYDRLSRDDNRGIHSNRQLYFVGHQQAIEKVTVKESACSYADSDTTRGVAGYSYSTPHAVPGACGSVLVDARGTVFAIHCAGNVLMQSGMAHAVTRNMVQDIMEGDDVVLSFDKLFSSDPELENLKNFAVPDRTHNPWPRPRTRLVPNQVCQQVIPPPSVPKAPAELGFVSEVVDGVVAFTHPVLECLRELSYLAQRPIRPDPRS